MLVAGVGVAVSLAAFPAGGGGAVSLRTDSKTYGVKRPVRITLKNPLARSVSFQSPWAVKNRSGETVAALHFKPEERQLGAGEKRTWTWDGSPNSCGTDGACTSVGGYVSPGRYRAVVKTDQGKEIARFSIGRYFTLGFRERPNLEFVVFSIKGTTIGEMRAEAKAEEKTKIVSGIVRLGSKPYNPEWKFTMGPASIVLGEVFTEVCDGSPYYVQRNRSSWEGERWCPWDSYVKRTGK